MPEKKNLYFESNEDLMAYIDRVPDILQEAFKEAQPIFDKGVTADTVQACYDIVELLKQMLIILLGNVSDKYFFDESREAYVDNMLKMSFRWRRICAEAEGPGTGGTIVSQLVCMGAVVDMKIAVEGLVGGLIGLSGEYDLKGWQERWKKAGPENG